MMSDEQYFVTEYGKVVAARRGRYGNATAFDFTTLPVLPFDYQLEGTETGWAKVEGIDYEPFMGLNNEYVEILKGSTFEHRVSHNGEWVYELDGNIRVDEVRIPSDCVAIESKKRLVIRKLNKDGETIRMPDNYGVIDFVEDEMGRPTKYRYFVPKSVVYKANPIALCIAKNVHGKVYYGRALRMVNGEEIFIYVIPYSKSSESEGTNKRIISIKIGCEDPEHAFDKEIASLCSFWNGVGVHIPNVPLPEFIKAYTRYYDAVKGSTNDKIRARGSIRFPKCRIVLRCMSNNDVFTGYCDMDKANMTFNFFTQDPILRRFSIDFNREKTLPDAIRGIKVIDCCLERIGAPDSGEPRWMSLYMNKYNQLIQSGQCNLCRMDSVTPLVTIGCQGCSICTPEEKVYYALFQDKQRSEAGIRWFPSVIFNPNLMGVQVANKYGANLVARHLEGIAIGEYTAIEMNSLADNER